MNMNLGFLHKSLKYLRKNLSFQILKNVNFCLVKVTICFVLFVGFILALFLSGYCSSSFDKYSNVKILGIEIDTFLTF